MPINWNLNRRSDHPSLHYTSNALRLLCIQPTLRKKSGDSGTFFVDYENESDLASKQEDNADEKKSTEESVRPKNGSIVNSPDNPDETPEKPKSEDEMTDDEHTEKNREVVEEVIFV